MLDLKEFFCGNAFNSYQHFGVHKLWKNGVEGFVFRVYAPNAKAVALICEFYDWQPMAMDRDSNGIYSIFLAERNLLGTKYKYQITTKAGKVVDKSDPYAFQSELRPNTASVVTRLDTFLFNDDDWLESRDCNYNKPMNIYEFHFGSWKHKPHPDGEIESAWYSYMDIAQDVIHYLKDNGYTHIELMPLNESPLDASWGYLVSGFYSVTSRYGSPSDLMFFVNECHKNNIGVIIDFVPVHFVADDFGLREFDGTPLYEYESKDIAYSEWGSMNFNLHSNTVRSFLMSAGAFWLDKFHIDGLRMDAISNAIYWQGNSDRGVNSGAIDFLRKLNGGLKERFKGIMLIAEDSTNYTKVTAPVEYDGLGFDYKWDMGWMHDTLEFFQTHPLDRRYKYNQLSFSMLYFYSDLFLLPFSHDEIVHGKATIMQKMWGDYEDKFPQCKALYTYMYTHPGKKLNFMGNEIGQFREWDENREVDWFLLQYPKHDEFHRYVKSLNHLYKDTPALYSGEYNPVNFKWLVVDAHEDCVYCYMRKFGDSAIITILNLSLNDYIDYTIGCDEPLTMVEVLNSDSKEFGGKGMVNDYTIKTNHPDKPYKGHPYSFTVNVPHFSGIVLRVL
jgi:1,4-alpha-glucan branching enzyme